MGGGKFGAGGQGMEGSVRAVSQALQVSIAQPRVSAKMPGRSQGLIHVDANHAVSCAEHLIDRDCKHRQVEALKCLVAAKVGV